jgi:hypothetical protein
MIVNTFKIFISKLTILYDTLERSVLTTIWLRSTISVPSAIFFIAARRRCLHPRAHRLRPRAWRLHRCCCHLRPRAWRLQRCCAALLEVRGVETAQRSGGQWIPGVTRMGGGARTLRLCVTGMRPPSHSLRWRGCVQDEC